MAVLWIDGLVRKGLYTPKVTHGPQWGLTTLAVAWKLAELTECRPGAGYLARLLGLQKRAVQYHLAHLREAGLLVYRSRGTRISGGIRLASHYERIIPAAFDEAHSVRTVQHDETAPAYTRVPVGSAPEHRKALGRLAKRASRKPRRRTGVRCVSPRRRCTPVQVGTSAAHTWAFSHVPPESKLEGGHRQRPIPPQMKRTRPRGQSHARLNRVGRRYQLARQLISQVSWLAGAPVPRVAWIARHVADAGWTALEVQAVAEDAGPLTRGEIQRPVGMLAHRLKGAHRLFITGAARRSAVHAWQECRSQEHSRHNDYEHGLHNPAPGSLKAREIANRGMARIRKTLAAQAADAVDEIFTGAAVDLDTLAREDIIQFRMAAADDPRTILAALHSMSEPDARRLYSNALVDRALNAQRLSAATAQPA